MQTGCVLIDWEEALRRSQAGTLLDDVLEAGDQDRWLYRPSLMQWPSDSTMQYLAVAGFIKESTATLSEVSRTAIQMSIGKFMVDVPSVDDLSGALGDEGCIATISPVHAAEMAEAMARIDSVDLKRFFEAHAEAEWTDILQSFDKDVWQYLEQWRGMLNLAAEKRMGFHVYMG